MNIDQYSPQSGRFLKEDGTYINIADALGGTETGQIADIEKHAAHSGRFIKEDGTVINIAESIGSGGGGGGGGGSSDDSAPPIIETYNGQTIQCSMSADRPIKGLNLYATCEQKTTTGANLINPNGIEIGSLNGSTGELVDSNNRIRTSNIPVIAGKRYVLSGYSPYTIVNSHIFNGEGERISAFMKDSPIPSDGVSVRFMLKKSDAELTSEDVSALQNSLMFNEGTIATPYEPYTGGIPSPNGDYPQEIQAISDFVVKVKNSMGEVATPQTLNVTIPEQGFYGIPVSAGGNYTDTDGQQWICDEFDFTNKKFIKRTGRIEFDGSSDENWILNSATEERTRFYINVVDADGGSTQECLCNRAIYGASNAVNICFSTSGRFYINVDPSLNSLGLWRQYLSTHELDVIYQLETPIEYDLTSEQVEQFKKLKSYYGTTYIDNDAAPACNMTAEIIADTKLYIDSKFATLAGQILEMEV